MDFKLTTTECLLNQTVPEKCFVQLISFILQYAN